MREGRRSEASFDPCYAYSDQPQISGRQRDPFVMERAPIRVLVAEDFAPFREFICSTLGQRPSLRVICEVSDGHEAVQKAKELKPDLILLDIGLPTINGIEAARRIRLLALESKIIFLSQESSPDVIEEALRLGAWGYVLKTRAGSKLLAAIEAVCEGRRFVTGLSGEYFAEASLRTAESY